MRLFGIEALHLFFVHQRILGGLRRKEDGLHAVVIFLRYRIELVIVATCAAYGEAQECIRCGGDQIVQIIHPRLFVFQVVLEPEPQISGGDTAFV